MRWGMCLLFVGCLAVFGGCKGGASSPSASSGPACLSGLPAKVQSDCGCGAIQRETQVALEQTELNDLVKNEVMSCLNSDVSLDVLSTSIVNGKADGCIRKEQSLEPAVRDQAIAIVSHALSRTESQAVLDDQKVWHDCYARLMAPPTKPPTLATTHADLAFDIRSSATAISPAQMYEGKKLYTWKVWVAGIDAVMADLKEVYYSFDHPSFEGNVPGSTVAANSFRTEYRGWGCVNKLTATLVFNDGSRLAKTFDQCSVLPSGAPSKGGAPSSFGDMAGGSNAPPPRKCEPGEDPGRPEVQAAPKCVP